jgi:hypothetical protein
MPIAPGSICDLHGCSTTHPAVDHATYEHRYEHARGCTTCTVFNDHDANETLRWYINKRFGLSPGLAADVAGERLRRHLDLP